MGNCGRLGKLLRFFGVFCDYALGASLIHQNIIGKDCACFVVTHVVLHGHKELIGTGVEQ